ncbi:TRI14-like protein [Metarhizium album ARSEF 1941]|uniref:TRI14-like protein n=1 Tax=Metarhizium album (strain ARSEF 1941) TaxID=1081103 RepID=A0A0B2WMV9_METAS|nr:TRI14-like protein [Metarhizium album ARSEF 1941]KHN97406.1 TRI14-like protein [Metarhizium album ARSEF 1941]
MFFALVPLLAATAAHGSTIRDSAGPSGDRVVSSYQLYPENIDYNAKNGLAYMSVLYNSTIAVYEPIRNKIVDIIEFPPLSGQAVFHASGVQVDPLGYLSVIVNAGAAFDTRGEDISGDNFLIKYDLQGKKEVWRQNLTAVTKGVYNGFQDIEHDSSGTSFAVGTWPSSIVRVGADGKDAKAWYLTNDTDHTKKGLTALASKGNILLASEDIGHRLLRFDMTADQGNPTVVPIGENGTTPIANRPDGIYLPKRFCGNVLLVSSQDQGTIVLRSRDGTWERAEWLGIVPNRFASEGGSTTASVQMGDRIFASTEWFGDAANKVPGTLAGNRTEFPMYDITDEVVKFVG